VFRRIQFAHLRVARELLLKICGFRGRPLSKCLQRPKAHRPRRHSG
jgi:hypothetical protein